MLLPEILGGGCVCIGKQGARGWAIQVPQRRQSHLQGCLVEHHPCCLLSQCSVVEGMLLEVGSLKFPAEVSPLALTPDPPPCTAALLLVSTHGQAFTLCSCWPHRHSCPYLYDTG